MLYTSAAINSARPAAQDKRAGASAVLLNDAVSSAVCVPQQPLEPPVLLNEAQVAEMLGVSRRTVHSLREQNWFPAAIELGPRALRWNRAELLAAIAARAPRVVKHAEPTQLATSRAGRRVYRDGKAVQT